MSREASKPRDDADHRRMRGALVRLISPFIVVAIDVNREGSQRRIMLMLMPRFLLFVFFRPRAIFYSTPQLSLATFVFLTCRCCALDYNALRKSLNGFGAGGWAEMTKGLFSISSHSCHKLLMTSNQLVNSSLQLRLA